jgi:predicted transcriptional regulator
MREEDRIIIRKVNRPDSEMPEDLIRWVCKIFDFAETDKGIEPMLLKEIAEASFKGTGVTSKDLNSDLQIPRSTVLYHINRFISIGFITRKGTRYYLKSSNMTDTIEGIHEDIEKEFSRMIEYSERLDKIMEEDSYGGKRNRSEKRIGNQKRRKISSKG